jgi:hypothetical protein
MPHTANLLMRLALLLPTAYAFLDIRSRQQPSNYRATLQLHSVDPSSIPSDDEWHPRDPAHTTPQLLAGLWHQIAQVGSLVKGVSFRKLLGPFWLSVAFVKLH